MSRYSVLALGGLLLVLAGLGCTRASSASSASAALAPAEPGFVRAYWRLQSQENNYGFNVYRARSEDGPWTRVNSQIIPGHDTTSAVHEYEFFDTGLVIGETYWYYVESVSYDGVHEKITPATSVVSKPRAFYVEKGHDPPPID